MYLDIVGASGCNSLGLTAREESAKIMDLSPVFLVVYELPAKIWGLFGDSISGRIPSFGLAESPAFGCRGT